jgi:hypothetical protein
MIWKEPQKHVLTLYVLVRREMMNTGEASDPKHRDAFLWPGINQEDLLKPRTMLIFINARARNFPCIFWESDLASCYVSYALGVFEDTYLNRQQMLFDSRKTPETYGELVMLEDTKDGYEMLKNTPGLPPGVGLKLLEI